MTGLRVAVIRANRAVNVGWTNRCVRIASAPSMRTAIVVNSRNRANLFRAKIVAAVHGPVSVIAPMDGVDFTVKLVRAIC